MPTTSNGDCCVELMQGALVRPAARYPGAVAYDDPLKVAANRIRTTLARNAGKGDTVLTVSDASHIVPQMLLSIDSEIISVSSISDNILTVIRAFDGTMPAAHSAGSVLNVNIVAWHHNVLAAEITAIETALGPNLSNVGGGSGATSSYDFPAQTPGVDLVPGANAITLAPVPKGVSGTNTKHYLYVSGGTGTAEACLIIGGSAASGAVSGTLMIQCANAHTGPWTIRSATKGIQEAEKSLPAEGGVIMLPSGNLQMRASISYQRNRTFRGLGTATRLVPASGTAIVFDANLPVHTNVAHDIIADNITFSDFVIDGQSYVGVNSIIGVNNTAQNSTELYSIVGVRFVNIHFNNIHYGVRMQRVSDVSFDGVRSYANTQLRFDDTGEPLHHNFEIKINNFYYMWRLMEGNGMPPVLSAEAAIHVYMGELVYIANSIIELAGGSSGMDGITFEGGSEDLSIVNVAILQSRVGVRLIASRFAGVASYPGYVRVSNVSMDGLWAFAIFAEDGESAAFNKQVTNVLITNCLLTNPHASAVNVTVIYAGAWSRYWTIANTQINHLGTAYPQTGISIAANADYIYLDGNQVMNSSGPPGGHGIFIAAPAGVYGIESTLFYGLDDPLQDAGQQVASAATVTLPPGRTMVYITGTATINTINTVDSQASKRVTLIFLAAGATVGFTGNIRLNANYVATLYGSLTLEYVIGSNFWVELARGFQP